MQPQNFVIHSTSKLRLTAPPRCLALSRSRWGGQKTETPSLKAPRRAAHRVAKVFSETLTSNPVSDQIAEDLNSVFSNHCAM